MKKIKALISLGIVLVAAVIRLHIASIAYPPQLDSVHYVQYGVRWAQGVPGQLSTIWQEAPILIAGLAYKWGYDPVRTLQASTVIYGIVTVWMVILLGARLFKQPAIGWLAGLWAAASIGMVFYSVNCSAEGGFAMLMMIAYAMMATALRGDAFGLSRIVLAYFLLGLGVYYKPLDTLVSCAILTGWLFLVHLKAWRRVIPKLAAGLLIFVSAMVPHYIMQKSGSDLGEVPLINRGGNITLGEKAYQSKYVDAPEGYTIEERRELAEIGLVAWLWKHRDAIARRYASNTLLALRHFSDFIFPNAFRIGNALFIALLLLCFSKGLLTGYWRQFGFLALAGFLFTAGVSISYVYNRWLVIYVPLIILVIVAHVVLTDSLWNHRWKKLAWSVLLIAMMKSSHAQMVQQHTNESWIWANQKEMAAWLRDNSNPEEKVMSGRPTFAVEMDMHHPDRWVRMPHADLPRMEQFAEKKGATYIVLSSTHYPHWPVNQLLFGATPPSNWVLIVERHFERIHPIWGEQKDHYQIYKRIPQTAVESK